MGTATITHRKVSSGGANPAVEVDLHDWNDTHAVTELTVAIGSDVTGLGASVSVGLSNPINSPGGFISYNGTGGAMTFGTINGNTFTTGSVGLLITKVAGVNFNATADTAFVVPTLPTGCTRVAVFRAAISNASGTLTTSTFQVNSTTAGGGTLMVPLTTSTVSSAADVALNNFQTVNGNSVAAVAASLPTANTVYFRVVTPQGAARTADVTLYFFPLP